MVRAACAFGMFVGLIPPLSVAAATPTASDRTRRLSAGSLVLGIGEECNVTDVEIAGKTIPTKAGGGFRVTEVLPERKRTDHVWTRKSAASDKGAVRFDLRDDPAGLRLHATVTPRASYLDVAGEVIDTTGRDRALIVSFTLPVDTAGATFENTLRQHVRLTGRDEFPRAYEDTRHVGRFNGLRHSNCAFTALNFGHRAIAMAYPLHEPRLFLMRASPEGYTIEFHLGVSPETKKFPQRASFRFIVYAVDPQWGIRDAAAKYYAFFPDLFRTRATRHGNWGGVGTFANEFGDQHPEDFAFQFGLVDVQWRDGKMTDRNARFMRDTGVYAFHHREPWAWWHDQRDRSATKAPGERFLPVRRQTASQELDEVRRQAAGALPIKQGTNQLCGCPPRLAAQAAVNSHCIHYGELRNDGNQDPSLCRGLRHSYGCSQLAMNLDPELPKPNRAQIAEEWQFRYFFDWKDRGRTDPHGISWDSLTDWTLWRWINFRRDHFATADHPLVYSPRDGRLGRLNGFQNLEFAAWFSNKIHKAGGMVYVNTNVKEILFAAPYVDAFGIESTLNNARRFRFEELSMLRCAAYQKPISFYRAGDTAESGIRRGVLFGIFPGVAGVTEDQRALYKKYMPHLRAAAEAGWEPVTAATTENDGILIERFGGNARSERTVYFSLYNNGEQSVTATVTVDRAALGLPPLHRPRDGAYRPTYTELIQARPVNVAGADATPRLTLRINAGEALLLRAAY